MEETLTPTELDGADTREYTAGGSGQNDAYYDPSAGASDAYYDASAAYYQSASGGYDSSNGHYGYYAGAGTAEAAYYAGRAAAYAQDGYDYASHDALGDYNGGDSPTAAALPERLWYQDESALDENDGAFADEMAELQLDYGAGEGDWLASPPSWELAAIDAAIDGAIEAASPPIDAVAHAETLGLDEADATAETDSPIQVDHEAIGPTPVPDRQQRQTRQQRVQKRQELLEKQEEDRRGDAKEAKPLASAKAGAKGSQSRKSSFVARERAKLQLNMRIARAVARKRMPLQVRVLTERRTHSSPLEKYFGGPVESVLSDIFWAAAKGDVDRVQFLVQVEGVSAADGSLDPWNLRQSPLHWAAKGGSEAVIEFLLRAGANPRSLDENGSLPLHLACWAGHVDATLALLRASNVRDLYLPDYDAGLAPLDWATIRGHACLIKAIEKFEDTLWLPKFIDDLIRGIVKYKIKLFTDPPKGKGKEAGAAAPSSPSALASIDTETPAAKEVVSKPAASGLKQKKAKS